MGLISNVIATKWTKAEFGIRPNWLAKNAGVRIGTGIAIASGAGYHIYNAISDCLSNPVAGYNELTYPIIAGAIVVIAAVTTEISVNRMGKALPMSSAKGPDKSKAGAAKKAAADKAAAAKAAADKLDAEIKAGEEAAKAGAKKEPEKPADAINIDFQAGIGEELESDSMRPTGIYDGKRSYPAGSPELAANPIQAEEPTMEVGSSELKTALFKSSSKLVDIPKPQAKPVEKPVDPEEEEATRAMEAESRVLEKTKLMSGNPYKDIIKLMQMLPKGQLRNILTRLLDRAISNNKDDAQKAKDALIEKLEEINPDGKITEEMLVDAKLQALDL